MFVRLPDASQTEYGETKRGENKMQTKKQAKRKKSLMQLIRLEPAYDELASKVLPPKPVCVVS